MSTPRNSRGRAEQMLPRGETVASYESYQDAQRAIDALGQAEFPVRSVAIVGEGLRSVERVTGMMSYARAAGSGALSGAWMGTFLGLILIIMNPEMNLGILAAAVLLGAGFGMLLSIVTYSSRRRRKDYTSVMQMIATSYAVVVDPELANRARNILAGAPTPAQPGAGEPEEPPRKPDFL